MQITFTVSQQGEPNQTFTFASERALVEAIQRKLGVGVDGNWGARTNAALISKAGSPAFMAADDSGLRSDVIARLSSLSGARSVSGSDLAAALLTAYEGDLAPSPVTGLNLTTGATVPIGSVAPGATTGGGSPSRTGGGSSTRANTGTGTGTGSNPSTPGSNEGNRNPGALAGSLLGLPKNVVIGVAVGAGVLVLGGVALLLLTGNEDEVPDLSKDARLDPRDAPRDRGPGFSPPPQRAPARPPALPASTQTRAPATRPRVPSLNKLPPGAKRMTVTVSR